MEKLFVYFKADDQQLVCCNPFRVSSKKVAYVEAHFDLGENWTGYDSVRAIWRNTQNFAIIGTVLDSQGICKVPTEVLTSIGQVDVNLVGSISENNVLTDRLTTYPVEAGRVDANALVDGSETAEITPSQFEQFAAAVRNDAERAREGAEAAESYADAAAGSADDAAGSAQSAADDAARIAQMIQDVIDQIEDFYGVTVSVETLPAGSQATARYEEGHLYLGIPKGDKGDTGNGIASITKTGTSGLVDTYTITFTNGQTATFAVTNGEKGDTGNGIASITKTGTSGLVDTYTITYTDGQTETFTVTNGEKGDTGNGIDRIELTSTSGYVKTYTIYFTDGSTTTFEVTDGEVSLEDYYKLFIEDTASGSIASFPDGADDIPMISVLADIDPVQDLNGYDKPWPEGGEKNKCSLPDNTFVQFDEKEIVPIPSGAYVFSAVVTSTDTDSSQCAIVFLDADKNTLASRPLNRSTGEARVASTEFTVSAPIKYLRFYASNGFPSSAGDTATFVDMMIESGSSATAFAPYSNECPIYGHTKTDVTHTGKNLLDISKVNSTDKYIDIANNYWYTAPIKLKPNTQYTISPSSASSLGVPDYWVLYINPSTSDEDYLVITNPTVRYPVEAGRPKSITFTTGTTGTIRFGVTTVSGAPKPSALEAFMSIDWLLELGSTATAHEPFTGKDYIVEFEGHYTDVATNDEPYLFRTVGDIAGDRLREKIVGGTIAWNQRLPIGSDTSKTESGVTFKDNRDGSYTITGTSTSAFNCRIATAQHIKDHIYLRTVNPNVVVTNEDGFPVLYGSRIQKASVTRAVGYSVYVPSGSTYDYTIYPCVFDLTQMFGSSIADAVYAIEQANAGAGVAWFRKFFSNEYYEYNAGELKSVEGLQSHNTTEKNLLPQSEYTTNPSGVTNKYVNESGKFTAGTKLTMSGSTADGTAVTASNTQLQLQLNGISQLNVSPSMTITLSQDIEYDRLLYYTNASLANKTVKLQLELGSIATEYEPYVKHSYPLDNSLTLRGIPKMSDGQLYYEGDTYEADGTVTRKYGIVDLGSLTWTYRATQKMFTASLSNYKKPTGGYVVPNAISAAYRVTTISNVVDSSSGYDKVMTLGMPNNWDGLVIVRDESFTDAAAFKASVNGRQLCYELATPAAESADPFEEIQRITSGGIEQYVTESIVPVGHDTEYLSRVIYGGTVDAVSGTLAVKMGMVDLGTLNWIYMSSQGVFYSSEEIPAKATECFSDIYAYSSTSVGSNRPDCTINVGLLYFGQNKVSIKDSRYTDPTVLKQMLIDGNAQLCYELAEPQTYQLTGQQINSLLGVNNVWSDTGDVTVKYRADTKLYIDKVLAS